MKTQCLEIKESLSIIDMMLLTLKDIIRKIFITVGALLRMLEGKNNRKMPSPLDTLSNHI